MGMKTWYAITCPVCRFRHSLRKFTRTTEPIAYPAQLVTGGGRGSGFHVVRYLPWSSISSLRGEPEVWRAINCEYLRLASAYDLFYDNLGFLSPRALEITNLLKNEIFRLRNVCRELQERLGRVVLIRPYGGDLAGKFGRIIEEINRRDEEDRDSTFDMVK